MRVNFTRVNLKHLNQCEISRVNSCEIISPNPLKSHVKFHMRIHARHGKLHMLFGGKSLYMWNFMLDLLWNNFTWETSLENVNLCEMTSKVKRHMWIYVKLFHMWNLTWEHITSHDFTCLCITSHEITRVKLYFKYFRNSIINITIFVVNSISPLPQQKN